MKNTCVKILVTGGAGFIGANFVHYILKECSTWKVVVLDALTYAGNLNNLTTVLDDSRVTFIHGNICDSKVLKQTFTDHQFTYIVNFAAESHVDRSIINPVLFFETNVLGTQKLLVAARKQDIRAFLQVSTDEVYGSLGPSGCFTEKSALNPSSPYSASKVAAEMACNAYYKTFNFPVVITRGSNTYGRYQYPEKLIPLFTTKALNDEFLPLYGTGNNIRDWLHVNDHCAAILCVLEKGRFGEVYNVGGGHELASKNVTEMILTLLNKPTNLIKFIPDRPGHDFRYALDSTKITLHLGWKPIVKFKDGFKETIEWYQKQFYVKKDK